MKRWVIAAAAILIAGSVRADTNMHAVARMAAQDITYSLSIKQDMHTERVSPEGALVSISVTFGKGNAVVPASEQGEWSKTTKGWTIAGSVVGALVAVDRVAAPNGWLWHKDREKDWAGVVDRQQYGSADSKSSGTQTTDAGGNNYYAEGNLTVNHGDEGNAGSDNEQERS